MNYDDLLEQALSAVKPKSFADILVERTEKEFMSPATNAEEERVKEKEALLAELKELRKKLSKTRNIKTTNPAIRKRNALTAEKRKKIEAEIEAVKDKLFVISEERLGAKIDPETLIKASAQQMPERELEISDWKSVY